MLIGKESIIAAIISYNPDIDLLKSNILGCYRQVGKVLIIDNGSTNLVNIKEMICNSFEYNVVLIENNNNLGIGKALNIALKYSITNNYKWLFTLDQDSICALDYFNYILPMLCCNDVGIVYPSVIDRKRAELSICNRSKIGNVISFLKYHVKHILCGDMVLPITSGSLINIDIAIHVGGFCEAMFIDGVDFDFALKILDAKFLIVQCKLAQLYHNLGTPATVNIGGIFITASGHNPTRCYFMNRNAWILFYRYHKNHFKWTIFNIFAVFFMGFRNAFVTKEYRRYIYNTFRGQIDGINSLFKSR